MSGIISSFTYASTYANALAVQKPLQHSPDRENYFDLVSERSSSNCSTALHYHRPLPQFVQVNSWWRLCCCLLYSVSHSNPRANFPCAGLMSYCNAADTLVIVAFLNVNTRVFIYNIETHLSAKHLSSLWKRVCKLLLILSSAALSKW